MCAIFNICVSIVGIIICLIFYKSKNLPIFPCNRTVRIQPKELSQKEHKVQENDSKIQTEHNDTITIETEKMIKRNKHKNSLFKEMTASGYSLLFAGVVQQFLLNGLLIITPVLLLDEYNVSKTIIGTIQTIGIGAGNDCYAI